MPIRLFTSQKYRFVSDSPILGDIFFKTTLITLCTSFLLLIPRNKSFIVTYFGALVIVKLKA